MRFTNAWSAVLSQNIALRTMLITLSICLGLVTILAVKMGFEEPIVIERGCYAKVATKGSSERTGEEIEAFLKIALSQRFDSGVQTSSEVLSQDEISFKKQEQQELSSKNMLQKVIVNSVKVSGAEAKIEADRVISVGQIRTALSFPLTISIGTTSRSESNPYGLYVNRVSQTPQKKDDNQ